MLPDTTGVEPTNNDFTPLPEGEYSGEIVKVEDGESNNGTPFVNFEMVITEGEFAKRKVWRRAYLQGSDEQKTQTMLGMYAGLLEGLGMTQEQRHATRELSQLKEYAEGLEVEMYLTIKEYEGKKSNNVASMELIEAPFS